MVCVVFMRTRPINISDLSRPNLSRIDRTKHQWVEPNPSRQPPAFERVLRGFRCLPVPNRFVSNTFACTEQPRVPDQRGNGILARISCSSNSPSSQPKALMRRTSPRAGQTGPTGSTPCPRSTDGTILHSPAPSPMPDQTLNLPMPSSFSVQAAISQIPTTPDPTVASIHPPTREQGDLLPRPHQRPSSSFEIVSICLASPSASLASSRPSDRSQSKARHSRTSLLNWWRFAFGFPLHPTGPRSAYPFPVRPIQPQLFQLSSETPFQVRTAA